MITPGTAGEDRSGGQAQAVHAGAVRLGEAAEQLLLAAALLYRLLRQSRQPHIDGA